MPQRCNLSHGNWYIYRAAHQVGIHREGAFDDSVPPGETELILRLNRHGNTGTVYCIQANGAIYDTDQQSAEMRRREREEPQSKKKGGF